MTRRWQSAALLLPLLALAACAPESPERDASSQDRASDPILAPNSPVALTPYAQEGDAALIRGTLALEDGCLYLRDADGGRTLPTFPWPGTSWDEASQTLRIFGRQRFRVGDMVEAGGGFVTRDSGPNDPEVIQRLLVIPRPRCDVSRVAVLYFGPNEAPVR
jgi:hypothetical protein